jgi:uncharacterized protein (TIGR03435 family)
MRLLLHGFILSIVFTSASLPMPAQDHQLQYDITSVKPHNSSDGGMSIGSKSDGFSCRNVDLKTLIANAYGIRRDLISGGPGWVESTGFDVEGKVAGQDVDAFKKLTYLQRDELLQNLLVERFHLKIHHETKVSAIYDLVVAKGGPKLKALPPFTPPQDVKNDLEAAKRPGAMTMYPGMLKGQGLPMSQITANLANILEHTVVDKTGLTGEFDFDLKWHPDDAPPPTEGEPGVSLFTALQEQLGLKLQPTKGPVDVIVIDHAEAPSAN